MAGPTIGIMTRTALGHAGRPLKAGAAEAAMYWLFQFGAVARLCAALGPAALRRLSDGGGSGLVAGVRAVCM